MKLIFIHLIKKLNHSYFLNSAKISFSIFCFFMGESLQRKIIDEYYRCKHLKRKLFKTWVKLDLGLYKILYTYNNALVFTEVIVSCAFVSSIRYHRFGYNFMVINHGCYALKINKYVIIILYTYLLPC